MRFGLAVAGLLVAAALMPSPAAAYLVKANVQCPDVLKEDANPTFRLQNNWWVLGYISALNFANDTQSGEGVSSEDVYYMLLDFCEQHPEADIDEAGQYLYNILR
jgi:hypothetical protein